MTFNLALTVVVIGFIVLLLAMEVYTAVKGIPTISERIQALGRSAPLVTVISAFVAGMLLTHFFACGC